jgi:invasion protein IalB
VNSFVANCIWFIEYGQERIPVKKSVNSKSRLAISCALALVSISVFFARNVYSQPKPAEKNSVEAEPQSTSATFGDWILRCNRMEIADQPQRVCEVAQTIIIQGQQAPVAELAIGRLKKADPLRVTVVLPVNVAFPSAPQVNLDGQPSLELIWKRCLPSGCFADATPKDEVFRAWRASKTTGRIETKDAFGRNVVVTISFRGLSQALDALNKEP